MFRRLFSVPRLQSVDSRIITRYATYNRPIISYAVPLRSFCDSTIEQTSDQKKNTALALPKESNVKTTDQKALSESHYRMGECYESGIGAEESMEKAIAEWIIAADLGHAGAQYNLGVCYEEGNIVEQNQETAVEYYKKSAEQKDTCAMYNLGLCYFEGKGIDLDERKGFSLFEEAANLGDAHAAYNLGVCYENGIYVPVDTKKAQELFQKASDIQNKCAL